MNIATQGGKIIVKDGKAAENCNCCGGSWYCFPDEAFCPCKYAKSMPATLKADLSISVPGDLYLSFVGNFTYAFARCMKVEKADVEAFTKTYTLTRGPDFMGSPSCNYKFVDGPDRYFDTPTKISVVVGPNTTLNGANYRGTPTPKSYTCTSAVSSLLLDYVVFPLPSAWAVDGEYYTGPVNSVCSGFPGAVNNAAGRNYGGKQAKTAFMNIASAGGASGYSTYCGTSILYYGQNILGDWSTAGGGTFPCPTFATANMETIDHTWTCGLRYTDTTGSAPVVRVLPSCVSIRVYE